MNIVSSFCINYTKIKNSACEAKYTRWIVHLDRELKCNSGYFLNA